MSGLSVRFEQSILRYLGRRLAGCTATDCVTPRREGRSAGAWLCGPGSVPANPLVGGTQTLPRSGPANY